MLRAAETLLQGCPSTLRWRRRSSSGFTQYAYAFVAFEADKLQAQDARAAQQLNERAARLYQRAHRHAIRALLLSPTPTDASAGFCCRAYR